MDYSLLRSHSFSSRRRVKQCKGHRNTILISARVNRQRKYTFCSLYSSVDFCYLVCSKACLQAQTVHSRASVSWKNSAICSKNERFLWSISVMKRNEGGWSVVPILVLNRWRCSTALLVGVCRPRFPPRILSFEPRDSRPKQNRIVENRWCEHRETVAFSSLTKFTWASSSLKSSVSSENIDGRSIVDSDRILFFSLRNFVNNFIEKREDWTVNLKTILILSTHVCKYIYPLDKFMAYDSSSERKTSFITRATQQIRFARSQWNMLAQPKLLSWSSTKSRILNQLQYTSKIQQESPSTSSRIFPLTSRIPQFPLFSSHVRADHYWLR